MTPEQKLFQYMPTAVAMNYLKNVNKLTTEQRTKGQNTLEQGYGYIISLVQTGRDAGSFNSKQGSTGDISVTAAVLKFLSIAKKWMEIDDRFITGAFEFLKGKQSKTDGSFAGSELTKEASPSNPDGGVILTAKVAIAFLENTHYIERYKSSVIDKALNFIDGKFENLNDNYAVAISAYALSLGKHGGARKFIEKLSIIFKTTSSEQYQNYSSKSKMNEIAAYAILAYVKSDRFLEATKILRWLISRRDGTGSFESTQDTIVGLQAIAEMATLVFSEDFDMDIYFLDEHKLHKNIKINRQNAMELQTLTIPSNDGVSIQGNGTGVAYVQLWQTFFTKEDNEENNFKVTIKDGNFLNVCVSFNGGKKQSGQTIVEISLPSGYEYDDNPANAVRTQELQVILLLLRI